MVNPTRTKIFYISITVGGIDFDHCMHTFDIDTKSNRRILRKNGVMCEFKEKYHIDEINMRSMIFFQRNPHKTEDSAQNLDKLLIQ